VLKRLAALALLLGALAGTAHADTFAVVATTPVSLPGADAPNLPGSVAFPADLSAAPLQAQQLDSAQLQGLWQRAGGAYGIPWQVLAAINKVESNFGRNMGPSSAGAVGWMQFMPSTWERWGVDANGDGVADPWNADDAVYAAARYLAASGGQSDLYGAVFSYNHADWYVKEVLDLARLYGADTTVVFSLDRLGASLDAAERSVSLASQDVVRAEAEVGRLTTIADALRAREAATALLSDRLALGKQAGEAQARVDAAAAAVEELRGQLAQAQAKLDQARTDTQAASFDSAAGAVLGAPTTIDGWVFPVGGGASVVSAGHTHHDYPAVDIAAPEGSPVYAINNAVVLNAWHAPDPRCGIGLTIRTDDGQVWTYCHLSYEEASVQDGSVLRAGQIVGLVGATGHATGPHLHLQLQPATSWPQREAWFDAFAGSAFSWQDALTPERSLASAAATTGGAPVFAVVAGAPQQSAPQPQSDVVLFSR
jgi:murein DD-endopeptidase MepM/ murein hydrolase activator NlpD